MKKKPLAVLVTGLFFLCMTGMAHAALTTIGTATYDRNGGDPSDALKLNLIWDDDNNGNSVIWLDYTNEGTNGWQNVWAARLDSSLSYDINSVYAVVWDDAAWRMPSTVDGPYEWGYDYLKNLGYQLKAGHFQPFWRYGNSKIKQNLRSY